MLNSWIVYNFYKFENIIVLTCVSVRYPTYITIVIKHLKYRTSKTNIEVKSNKKSFPKQCNVI